MNYVATGPIFCRLIAVDRQGYGGSTPAPGRKVRDIADIVEAVLDHRSVDVAAVYGASGGGPHSLATAALLPDRISRAASLAGIGPSFGPGFDYGHGQVPLMREEIVMARASLDASRDFYRRVLANEEEPDIEAGIYSDNDRRIKRFVNEILAPVRNKIERQLGLPEHRFSVEDAYVDDFHSFASPWGFELGSIAVPVRIFHGLSDIMVPPCHSQWLQTQIPNASLELFPNVGHNFEQLMPHIFAWLAQSDTNPGNSPALDAQR
ncbi:alpha/beta hydrolase [Mesorhizobium sp. M0189]